MGRREVETFLSHLAQVEHVSPSTQNQALSAILFLYKDVLEMPLDQSINAARAKRGKHLPTVLSIDEVRRLLAAMQGTPQLIAQLLYGSGLRVEECLTLRVHQLDFANGWIMVIGGKGSKDGVTMLPKSLGPALEQHLIRVAHLHQQDLERGLGAVILPHAYHVKHPGASHDFKW
jgi:site-specific recombinase XerD